MGEANSVVVAPVITNFARRKDVLGCGLAVPFPKRRSKKPILLAFCAKSRQQPSPFIESQFGLLRGCVLLAALGNFLELWSGSLLQSIATKRVLL
jgi:hypothetical protein